MDPKQRVVRTCKRSNPDRVPLDGLFCKPLLEKLFREFDTDDAEKIFDEFRIDFRRVRAEPGLDFVKKAQPITDCPGAGMGRSNMAIRLNRYLFMDEWGATCLYHPESGDIMYQDHPLADAESVDEVVDFEFPDPRDSNRYESLKQDCRKYGGKYAVIYSTNNFFKGTWHIRGLTRMMMDLHLNSQIIEAILEKLEVYKLVECTEVAKSGVDIINIGGDIGGQISMLINPEMWRRFFKPRLKNLIRHVKDLFPDILFMFHSDGYMEPVITDLIECGVDILDPIQPECMNPFEIKMKYGAHITLHGTVSTQATMPFGSVEKVKEVVIERIEKLGKRFGFILAPDHTLQQDVPVENVLAFFETAGKYAGYRI